MPLHDGKGRRKSMTADARPRFPASAEQATRETRSFCLTLCYTGCRLSEALALAADRVDLDGGGWRSWRV
jgi:integrase